MLTSTSDRSSHIGVPSSSHKMFLFCKQNSKTCKRSVMSMEELRAVLALTVVGKAQSPVFNP